MKFDGYRALAAIAGRPKFASTPATATTGPGSSHSLVEPLVQAAPRARPSSTAKIVAFKDGRTDFSSLKDALSLGRARSVYFAFDLLELDGEEPPAPAAHRAQGTAPQAHRQDARTADAIHFSDHIVGNGQAFFTAMSRGGYEGMVAKLGERALSRRAHQDLAQDQVPAAPGIRHRRLAALGQEEALRLAAARHLGQAAN